LEANPQLTPLQVRKILHESAEKRGEPDFPDLSRKWNRSYGYGMLDAYEAVKLALEYPQNEPQPNEPPQAVTLQPPLEVTNNSLDLVWSRNEDDDFSKYEVHMSLERGFTPADPTVVKNIFDRTVTEHHVWEIEAETEYFFRVRTFDTEGQFNDSNEVSAVTLPFSNGPIDENDVSDNDPPDADNEEDPGQSEAGDTPGLELTFLLLTIIIISVIIRTRKKIL